MEECYLIVVEKMLKQSCSHLVACTFMEMATQFELLHNYTKSFEYLIKGLLKFSIMFSSIIEKKL